MRYKILYDKFYEKISHQKIGMCMIHKSVEATDKGIQEYIYVCLYMYIFI